MKKQLPDDMCRRDTNYSKRILKGLIIAGFISTILWAIAWVIKVVNEPQGQEQYDSYQKLNRK